MELPVLLAPNTAAVASGEPGRTTSSSTLEAAERPAPTDRNTRAMASAWRASRAEIRCKAVPMGKKTALETHVS